MAYAHLPAYLQFPEKVKVTAVCDIREEAAKKFAKTANIHSVYTDFEKMLNKEDIDAVDICTIHDQHRDQTIIAVELGKNILLEKPMACSMEDCRDMVKATEKAGVTYMIAQVLRYLPSSQGVVSLMENGEIGPVHAVQGTSILKQSLILPHDHWMFDGNRAGGGVLITLSIHIIDLLRYFIGDVKKVSGICKNFDPLFINGAEDFSSATLEFNTGTIGNIFGSLSTGRTPFNIRYMIFGDSGTIYSNPPSSKKGHYQIGNAMISSKKLDKEGKTSQKGEFIHIKKDSKILVGDNPFINEVIHFVDCCQNNKEPISSGKDNLNTMKIIFGIYKSSKTNTVINLNDV
ncbi:MAG: Gfo/Idh/MocA family oxidoreductase [Candidatus Lokiarchaeota archaeon]|nr:Gfo/Idh/MocA family oxidoreductase [Candidatus Lokiarchaeota archaeon]